MAQAAASTCEICTGGPGDHYCQQCYQSFCRSCKISHLRAKISKSHTFSSGPNINKEENLLCTEHKESFLFYCKDCETQVCKIGTVQKHSRHLLTDLTNASIQLRSELSKNIDVKITTSKLSLSKIETDTKAYREEVKAVIKTITEEGNYWKNLIDKKVDNFVRLVHDEKHKTLQNMATFTTIYRGDVANCQQWQKNIKEMEPIADELLLQKLKKLKVDVDNRSSVSYRNKKPSGTEIDSLFGELQFKEVKSMMERKENQQNTRPLELQNRYRYMCGQCRTEQISTEKPTTKSNFLGECSIMKCRNSVCQSFNRPSWHNFIGEA